MDTAATSIGFEVRSASKQSAASNADTPARRARTRIAVILAIGAGVVGELWLVVTGVIEAERVAGLAHASLIVGLGIFTTIMLGVLGLLLIMEIRRNAERETGLARQQAILDAKIRSNRDTEERLRFSDERLRDFAVMSSDWLWEQDADLRFTAIGFEAPNDARDGKYLGKRRWEMQDTSQAPEHWAQHQREVMNHRPFRDFRYTIVDSDGTHHVSVNGTPVFDEAGQFAGYRGTGRRVTQEVEAEAALRDAKNRAEQAEALLRDAVNSMSEGFVIYDSEDRLLLCNDAYRRMYPQSASLMCPG